MSMAQQRNLRRLAALHGVQTSYIDMHGRRQSASPEALLAVMQALGAPLQGMADVDEAIQVQRDRIIGEWIAPVIVAWEGEAEHVSIRVPASVVPTHAISRMQYTLHLENGDIWSGNVSIDQAKTLRYVNCAGEVALVKAILPPKTLPLGYHSLTVLIGRRAFSVFVIAAPRQVYHNGGQMRQWGLFAPIYALRSERNWGVGDYTDAAALASWGGQHGSTLFGTLPFLANYVDSPCDPSPYTPVSRFFWNELFVDVTRLPELSTCQPAQELIASEAYQTQLHALRRERLVDYKAAMKLKRDVLLLLSQHVAETGGMRYESLRAFAETCPEVRDYARFRAVTTRRGDVWTCWPEALRDGCIGGEDHDHAEELYHLYAQFIASEQVESLVKRCEAENVILYLDYPVGTHPAGFDTWRHRERFALDATVGAPPDPVFTTGQDWGFHPLLPEQDRRSRYAYFAASIRHQMKHAGMLRLDHVMGLHRLYWIPQGFHKSEGVYVHNHSDELYAILALESKRARTAVVGENLGIVPGYVYEAMRQHEMIGMNIAYWELACDPDGALGRMATHPDNIASLNTHDMFPFAAFWNGLDADRRAELGMITEEQADLERWQRGELRARLTGYLREHGFPMESEYDTAGALRGILSLLSGSSAKWMLVNLEDLWLETSPQNIPDTIDEHPNWRQKTKLALEEMMRDEGISELLGMIDTRRSAARSGERG